MKTLIFVLFVFLAACSARNDGLDANVNGDEAQEPETFEVLEVQEQTLLVQGVKVDVTRALVNPSIYDHVSVIYSKHRSKH